MSLSTSEGAVPRDARLALCLSGGGFRAALFHLGALRRLDELGVLPLVDVISSVSGGSMLASLLARHLKEDASVEWNAFETEARAKLARPLAMAGLPDLNPVVLRRVLGSIHEWVGGMRLEDLPQRPSFLFNATELHHGEPFVFARDRIGSEALGWSDAHGNAPVAEAVAASACFPVFAPILFRLDPADFRGGARPLAAPTDVRLVDGGVFDNLGLHAVRGVPVALLSDAGRRRPPGRFAEAAAELAEFKSWLGPVRGAGARRAVGPAASDAEALLKLRDVARSPAAAARREALAERFLDPEKGGSWSIASSSDPGYPPAIAAHVAGMRTQLDGFTDAEGHVLVNHGYLTADAALRGDAPPAREGPDALRVPHPEALDVDFAARALARSHLSASGARWLWDLVEA